MCAGLDNTVALEEARQPLRLGLDATAVLVPTCTAEEGGKASGGASKTQTLHSPLGNATMD